MKQLSIKLHLEKSFTGKWSNQKDNQRKEDNQIIDYNVILNRNVH